MLTRRDFVRCSILAGPGTVAANLLAGCGGRQPLAPAGPAAVGGAELARSLVPRTAADPAVMADAAEVVRAFTADLYRRLSGSEENVVCSPYTVAVALAMTRTGARGRTAAEMDRVLHAPGPQRLDGGLGALEALLEKRSGPVRRADGSTAKVELHVANSLWGQRGLAWQTAFLDALARHYGAGMRLVDYRRDAETARSQINAWTRAQTHGKIDQLLPEGVLDELTRLVLVNALYLKAPWEQPFPRPETGILPFTRADGSTVGVPTMRTEIRGARHARGDGWEAAELPYAGNGLAMTVIMPDAGTLRALESSLDGDRLVRILRSPVRVGALDLRLPKWTFRTRVRLDDILAALGMPTAFDHRTADFTGMTTQEKLFISAVLHEAFVAVDEAGTEAGAATAVVASVDSAGPTPVPMIVDRPFLFLIHDLATSTPLFLGRVTDPTA
jgi:serine protease inhibitor